MILAILLLGLLLAPLEMLGVLRKGVAQLREIVSSGEVQVLGAKIKAGLPNLGARITEFLSKLFPQLEIRIKEVR